MLHMIIPRNPKAKSSSKVFLTNKTAHIDAHAVYPAVKLSFASSIFPSAGMRYILKEVYPGIAKGALIYMRREADREKKNLSVVDMMLLLILTGQMTSLATPLSNLAYPL